MPVGCPYIPGSLPAGNWDRPRSSRRSRGPRAAVGPGHLGSSPPRAPNGRVSRGRLTKAGLAAGGCNPGTPAVTRQKGALKGGSTSLQDGIRCRMIVTDLLTVVNYSNIELLSCDRRNGHFRAGWRTCSSGTPARIAKEYVTLLRSSEASRSHVTR